MISVVIPAHNEASVIGRLLSGLQPGIAAADLEVVVVANGCTDATAEAAAKYPGVKVIELEHAHKPSALNEGERHVSTYPRFFLDADVQVTASDLTALATELSATDALAVAPSLRLDTTHSSWLVRSYSRIWGRLPAVSSGLSSRGCFGVSKEGRARWREFPDVLNDDRFVHTRFQPSERLVVAAISSVVSMPATIRGTIRRRARVHLGNRQLVAQGEDGGEIGDRQAWLAVVARAPQLMIDVPAYVFVTMAARLTARRVRPGSEEGWMRDDSMRSVS